MAKKIKTLTRDQFREFLRAGRLFAKAGLYERHDFMVEIAPGSTVVVREITDEPAHHHRAAFKAA